jgi:rod shape-determining protein MreD
MPRIIITLILGYLLIVLASVWHDVFGIYVRPDFLIILVVYTGIKSPDYKGAATVALLGFMMDIFSGYMVGLFMLISLLNFIFTMLAARLISFDALWTRTIFALFACIVQQVLLLFILNIFQGPGFLESDIIIKFVQQTVLTLVAAWLIFALLDKLESKFLQESQAFE